MMRRYVHQLIISAFTSTTLRHRAAAAASLLPTQSFYSCSSRRRTAVRPRVTVRRACGGTPVGRAYSVARHVAESSSWRRGRRVNVSTLVVELCVMSTHASFGIC